MEKLPGKVRFPVVMEIVPGDDVHVLDHPPVGLSAYRGLQKEGWGLYILN